VCYTYSCYTRGEVSIPIIRLPKALRLKQIKKTGQRDRKALIIIPAYNEADSIGEVISSIRAAVDDADIVVINDGSTDNTAEVVRELNTAVISHPCNMGIGATMQTGYRYAASRKYQIAIQVDADGQHPPDQINRIIQPLIEGTSDVAIGSRFIGKSTYTPSVARKIGILIFARVISLIVGKRFTDTTSGFRAANREVINFYAAYYPEDYPEVEALILLHKAGFTITELPVTMKVRTGGTSSITSGRAVYYMIKVLLAISIDLIKKVER